MPRSPKLSGIFPATCSCTKLSAFEIRKWREKKLKIYILFFSFGSVSQGWKYSSDGKVNGAREVVQQLGLEHSQCELNAHYPLWSSSTARSNPSKCGTKTKQPSKTTNLYLNTSINHVSNVAYKRVSQIVIPQSAVSVSPTKYQKRKSTVRFSTSIFTTDILLCNKFLHLKTMLLKY